MPTSNAREEFFGDGVTIDQGITSFSDAQPVSLESLG